MMIDGVTLELKDEMQIRVCLKLGWKVKNGALW